MIIGIVRCPKCSSYVIRDIQFSPLGTPIWKCPVCYTTKEDYSWFRYVTQREAREIINRREPHGRFVQEDGNIHIGIDNCTGEAWVEEFSDMTECLMWLAREKEGSSK